MERVKIGSLITHATAVLGKTASPLAVPFCGLCIAVFVPQSQFIRCCFSLLGCLVLKMATFRCVSTMPWWPRLDCIQRFICYRRHFCLTFKAILTCACLMQTRSGRSLSSTGTVLAFLDQPIISTSNASDCFSWPLAWPFPEALSGSKDQYVIDYAGFHVWILTKTKANVLVGTLLFLSGVALEERAWRCQRIHVAPCARTRAHVVNNIRARARLVNLNNYLI